MALVPLIGLVIAAIPVLFVAFTTSGRTGGLLHVSGGWKLALACSVILVVAQQIDLRLLSPRLLSRTVRLHPVTVLLSLLVGGTLQGLWGMLLAVPFAAALKVLLLHMWDTRSQWPPRGAPASEPAPAPAAEVSPRPAEPEPATPPGWVGPGRLTLAGAGSTFSIEPRSSRCSRYLRRPSTPCGP